MIIYLIRHGRQSSSDCNVNVPLAKAGIRQAELLGVRMQQYPIDALYSSNLIRAVETAKIAFAQNQTLLAKHQIREGLAEVDFGELTGQPDPEVKKYYVQYYERQRKLFDTKEQESSKGSAFDQVKPFVGEFMVPLEEMWYPNGENGAMVLERVMPVVKEWLESDAKQIAVVTHGGVIRILLCALFGGDFCRRLQFGTSLENCSITQIHYDEEKNVFFLDRFNDYAHIEGEPSLLRGK